MVLNILDRLTMEIEPSNVYLQWKLCEFNITSKHVYRAQKGLLLAKTYTSKHTHDTSFYGLRKKPM